MLTFFFPSFRNTPRSTVTSFAVELQCVEALVGVSILYGNISYEAIHYLTVSLYI